MFPDWFQTTLYTGLLVNIKKWMKITHFFGVHVSQLIFEFFDKLSHYTQQPFKNAVGYYILYYSQC